MVPSTPPDEKCPDSIEEGPLAADLLLTESSPSATLSSGAGLVLIDDDDDGPPLLSDSEVGGTPSANLSDAIPPKTPPPITGVDEIEIDDDDDNGPELPPSMMPAATLKMEETRSNSKKKVETIDDDESAMADNFRGINQIDNDDDKLAAIIEREYSGSNSMKRTAESNTQHEAIGYGDDSIGACVDGIADFRSSLTRNVSNWEQDCESGTRRGTLPGVTRVTGIFSHDEADIDVLMPEAVPVGLISREGYQDDNVIMASRLEPWLRQRRMRQLLVTTFILLAGSAIAYVISRRYACVANSDCDDGIWCNGDELCNESGVCQSGAPQMCSDGLLCTDDVCNESAKSCENPAADCLASGDPCATDTCVESLNGCQFTCGATLETWMNVTGVSVGSIKTAINSGVEPNTTERLGSVLENLHELGADYGDRMKGWLVPPITGEYIFWIAAYCQSELWLSTDDNPENVVLICKPQVAAPGPRMWVYPSQKSEKMSLTSGRAYYFEAFAKNRIFGCGVGYLSIAWEYPGQALEVIPTS